MLRKPDSISASDTVITDPALEPFFVSRSQTGGYTLYERVIKGENNTEYIKTICYPSNFSNALKKSSRGNTQYRERLYINKRVPNKV